MEQHYGNWLCRGENVSVYYARLQPNFLPEHCHRQAELLLSFDQAEAQIRWRTENDVREAAIGPHQFCIIPPHLPHACEWKSEADVVVVYLDEEWLNEHLPEPLDEMIVEDFQPLSRLDACLWSLGTMFKNLCRKEDFPPASFIEGIGAALASRTLEQHFQKKEETATEPEQRLSPETMRKVREYVDAHLRENIAVEDLARHVGLSERHFGRLFRLTTGSPPVQFVLKHRVQRALELLRTGEYRIAEVAYEVGFYDQSHLDRHCRKFFGFPPKQAMRMAESSLKMSETSKIPALEMV